MYEPTDPGVWLHATAVHPVQSGLCALQNKDTSRETKMF